MNSLKFFLYSANPDDIADVRDLGLLDGIAVDRTTIEEDHLDFAEGVREICKEFDVPVIVKISKALEYDEDMLCEKARKIASWGGNIVVNIPISPIGIVATRRLTSMGVKVNSSRIFTLTQALIAARAGASYISPFVGRIDEIVYDGTHLVSDAVDMIDDYDFEAEIIADGIRTERHLVEAIQSGAHVATVTYETLLQSLKTPGPDQTPGNRDN